MTDKIEKIEQEKHEQFVNEKIEEICSLMSPDVQNFYKRLQKIKIQEIASTEICIICYNASISIFAEPLPCGHVFHPECIKAWLKYQKKCPYCKNAVNQFKLRKLIQLIKKIYFKIEKKIIRKNKQQYMGSIFSLNEQEIHESTDESQKNENLRVSSRFMSQRHKFFQKRIGEHLKQIEGMQLLLEGNRVIQKGQKQQNFKFVKRTRKQDSINEFEYKKLQQKIIKI